jgi:uncharacterized protein (DUF1800 family)
MTDAHPLLDRRSVLKGAAGLGAAAALQVPLGGSAAAAAVTPTDPLLHLLRRATYGPTPALVDSVRRRGTNLWLVDQLYRSTWPDPSGDAVAARWPVLRQTSQEIRAGYGANSYAAMYALREAHVARAAWSSRQILELMVDFWSNHLNVPNPLGEVWDVRHSYDRDVIRRYALGRFSDLLVASAKHPAMLRYLDNANSTKTKPNENYARESLELHTVGVGAGYTEADVKQAALLLSGMTVVGATGAYAYVPSRHYVGRVTIMGFTHANATAADGEAAATAYLQYLARHPSTASHIAYKLAQRFVADKPPADLVATLAQAYLDNDTRISTVLQLLFTSAAFRASAGAKVRTPFEDVVATVRLLGIGPDADGGVAGIKALFGSTSSVGQAPLAWPAPNGYPDVAAAWSSSSSTVARWNLHYSLASGGISAALAHPARASFLPSPLPTTHGALIDALCDRLLLPRRSSQQRAALCTFVNAKPETALTATSQAATSRLPHLMALLLDCPDFFLR